ncbi:MAG TPA: DnaA/Hda family protein [Gemmatimonadaceae bacterium]|nr:DnaA/Hda family protein [Gemmatimonadaceae bacterium]
MLTAGSNGTYRFENFIVGSANHLAVAAARAVAQSPGSAYNPLFIYSGSGLGKTHLLLAIASLATQLQPGLPVLYTTLDEFVDELHAAVEDGSMDAFKERYQSVSMLLVDDVQFLADRHETEGEMLRLFNALQQEGKQIVLASDRPPAEIADLDERLITRFSGGLMVDMGPPDFETRVAILRRKAEERGVQFDADVMEEVAHLEFTNVRELQGALNRLIAYQTLGQTPVTAQNIRTLLGAMPMPTPTRPVATFTDGASASPDEFVSFLKDVSAVVAEHIEPWRVRVGEAAAHWRESGYQVATLERLLDAKEAPDVEREIERYEQTVARLEELAREAAKLDAEAAADDVFHDPERIAEAELVVARLLGSEDPPPGPNPDLARADFEVGASNQLAAHSADTIIEEPGRTYNPLFIHGPSGVGKTHLLHAIGNELMAMRGGAMRVACVSASAFVDELIAALQDGTVERWRARYRFVDALLLDDVQLLADKERTQEEIFHVFNALHAEGRQIVLVADRAPRLMDGIEERLRSRFEGGLVVEISAPDTALREKLYARQLTAAGVDPERTLVEYLAARPAESACEIHAMVGRLVQAAGVVGVPLTRAFARMEIEGGSGSFPVVQPVREASADPFFLDDEKVVWDWPEITGRAIEELR